MSKHVKEPLLNSLNKIKLIIEDGKREEGGQGVTFSEEQMLRLGLQVSLVIELAEEVASPQKYVEALEILLDYLLISGGDYPGSANYKTNMKEYTLTHKKILGRLNEA